MKLYDVPNNSKIRVNNQVLTFHKLDGMYSLCTDEYGNTCHLSVGTEVEIIKQ